MILATPPTQILAKIVTEAMPTGQFKFMFVFTSCQDSENTDD